METKSCRNGHAMTEANTYVQPKTGISECRACRNNKSMEYKVKSFFGGNRERAIQRDGEKCVKCGITRVEHKAKYGICHQKQGVIRYDTEGLDRRGIRQIRMEVFKAKEHI